MSIWWNLSNSSIVRRICSWSWKDSSLSVSQMRLERARHFRGCPLKGNAKWNWCTSSQSNAYDGWVKQSWCLLFSFFLFLIKYYMTHLPFSKHTVSQARRSKQMKQWTYIISDVAERKRSRVLSYFMNTTNNKGKLWHRLHISNKLK